MLNRVNNTGTKILLSDCIGSFVFVFVRGGGGGSGDGGKEDGIDSGTRSTPSDDCSQLPPSLMLL